MADVVIPDMTAAERLAVQNQPQPLNLLGIGSQALQMRGQMLQNQGLQNDLALFGAKQAAGQATLNALNPDGTYNQDALRSNLQSSGNPLVGMVAPDYVNASNVARNSATQNQGQTLDQQLAKAKGRGNIFKAWLALPPNQRTTQSLDAMINDAGAQFGSPSDTAAMIKHYNSVAPGQLENVVRGDVALSGQDVGSGGAIVNTGPNNTVVNTNPYAPKPVGSQVGGPIANGLPPASATDLVGVPQPDGSIKYVSRASLQKQENGGPTAPAIGKGPSTQEQAANQRVGEAQGNQASSFVADSTNLAQTRAALQGMRVEMANANGGPLADMFRNVGATLGELGIANMNQADAYDLLQKGQAQVVVSRVADGLGVPTDGKMAALAAQTPGAHMTGTAGAVAVGQIQGVLDYQLARAKAAQAAGVTQNPAMSSQFNLQWQQRFPNASVFQFNYLPKAYQQKYWNSMSTPQKQQFYHQLMDAVKSGYTEPPNLSAEK